MTEKPLISVIVATRNRPLLLRAALASVAAQDLPAGTVEAVVVNDGGVDVTTETDAAAEGLPVQPVTLVRRQGLPAARNAGMQAARCTYLAFLDDDDLLLPHHLRTALDALDEGDCDAAYTTCLVSRERADATSSTPVSAAVANGYPFDPDLLSVANYIPVHSAVLRRPASPDARFDPTLTALEDWDMWQRLVHGHGYRFRHLDEPTVVYHRIPQQTSMISAAVSDAPSLAGFSALVQRLWQRWPATSDKVTRFRAYVGVMYWQALGLLATGRPVGDLYFPRCLGILVDAWTGAAPEDGIIDRIRTAVEGDADAADVA